MRVLTQSSTRKFRQREDTRRKPRHRVPERTWLPPRAQRRMRLDFATLGEFGRMSLSVGDKLGPYELVACIGSGGMGEVWKATDTRLNRTVALKRLKGEHGARFEQEARAIASLNHSNICHIYDVGPGYLVLEYVEGAPLCGPMGAEEATRAALQIAGALEEAHARGILHRDLKPANILLTLRGSVKLLDFGIAKLMTDGEADATRTVEGALLGTLSCMSPEQAEGKQLDARIGHLRIWRDIVRAHRGEARFREPGGSVAGLPQAARSARGIATNRGTLPSQAPRGAIREHGGRQSRAGGLRTPAYRRPTLDRGPAVREHERR